MGGAFWGFLWFGRIFFVPFLAPAVIGASMGALTGSMAHAGIDGEMTPSSRFVSK